MAYTRAKNDTTGKHYTQNVQLIITVPYILAF